MQDKIVKKINKCLSGIKRNDPKALEELFLLTKEHLRKVAVYYLYDKNSLDDVLSDAYLHVVKYIASFDVKKNGYNWLYQIVKNLAFDYNRFQANHPTEELSESDSVLLDFTESLISIITVRNAVKQLDETERKIIHELYWADKNISTVAIEMGIPYMTLHDKIKKIIKKLENDIGTP